MSINLHSLSVVTSHVATKDCTEIRGLPNSTKYTKEDLFCGRLNIVIIVVSFLGDSTLLLLFPFSFGQNFFFLVFTFFLLFLAASINGKLAKELFAFGRQKEKTRTGQLFNNACPSLYWRACKQIRLLICRKIALFDSLL